MFRIVSTSLLTAAMALALGAACTTEVGDNSDINSDRTDPAFESSLRNQEVLEPMFERAADEFRVPAGLLKAISYTETRWQMIVGEEEHEGRDYASGLMALRGDRVTLGAQLASTSEDAVRTDAQDNIRAAAALLSSYADELEFDRADLGAWAPAVARLSGIQEFQAQAHFIHDDVYEALRSGALAFTPEGELSVAMAPSEIVPDFPLPMSVKAAGPDYAGSVWHPSPNKSSRPSGSSGDPSMVIIHTCEGSYSGCWGWLTNSASGVSAHYVVKEDGSEISQLVRDSEKAWHIGASYQCSRNNSVDCWRNGSSSNNFTIGIEHAGYGSQSSWALGLIDASARLVCDITRDNDIPRDSYHIVGHGQLQPYNRTDPGPNWPWADYLDRIGSYCGDNGGDPPTDPPTDPGDTFTTIIVDSNNSNNDSAKGFIEVSSNWNASANVSGFYGTGYWWSSTESISDGASFKFYLPSDSTRTVEAWWSSSWDRSDNAPFIMYDSDETKLDTVWVNQQDNGGQWNTLGTFDFKAGWNKVMLSRWTGAGSVVIADAVRIR